MNKFIKDQFNKNDALLKHTLVIFAGSMLGNVLNYLYHLLVVRSLSPFDYGIFSSLFALLYVVLMAAGVLGVVVTKYTADYYAKGQYGKIKSLFTRLSLKAFVFGLIGFLLFTLCSRFIADFMNIESIFPILLIGLIGFLSLFSPIYGGILAGLQKFNWKACAGTITPIFKITFLILFIYLGYKVNGALFALVLAQIIATIFYIIPNLFLLRYKREPVDKKAMLKFVLPTFIGTVLPMILINIDIILVKHYLPSVQAGYYGAASMLAKIIFFATGPLVIVMFPKISRLHSNGDNTDGVLKASIFYTFLISFFGVMVYYIAPVFVVNLLYGPDYKIAHLIGLFAIAMALFSWNNLLINYNLAKERFGFGYFVIFIGIIEVLAIVFFHGTLIEIIKILVISFALLFVCLLFYTSRDLGIRFPAFVTNLLGK